MLARFPAAFLTLALAWTASCGPAPGVRRSGHGDGGAEAAPARTRRPAPAPSAADARVERGDAGPCAEMRAVMRSALHVEAGAPASGPVEDPLDGRTAAGCRVEGRGTTGPLPEAANPGAVLSDALARAGWTADPHYDADSPDAYAGAASRAARVCVYRVELGGADGGGEDAPPDAADPQPPASPSGPVPFTVSAGCVARSTP
jgi:hypothetical protein